MAGNGGQLVVDGRAIKITNPDKVMYPATGTTKGEVIAYYQAVAPWFVLHAAGRPATRKRWPNGVGEGSSLVSPSNPDGDAFYQKRAPKGMPDWVQTATVRFPSGRPAVQVCPADLATIVWMVNLGTVRFHPWPVRAPQTDLVDQLRIDLDPQPGTDFADAVAAALVLREVLTEAGLTGFAKTSGGRGLHVFAPIVPSDFIDARHATIAIGRELARGVCLVGRFGMI